MERSPSYDLCCLSMSFPEQAQPWETERQMGLRWDVEWRSCCNAACFRCCCYVPIELVTAAIAWLLCLYYSNKLLCCVLLLSYWWTCNGRLYFINPRNSYYLSIHLINAACLCHHIHSIMHILKSRETSTKFLRRKYCYLVKGWMVRCVVDLERHACSFFLLSF